MKFAVTEVSVHSTHGDFPYLHVTVTAEFGPKNRVVSISSDDMYDFYTPDSDAEGEWLHHDREKAHAVLRISKDKASELLRKLDEAEYAALSEIRALVSENTASLVAKLNA